MRAVLVLGAVLAVAALATGCTGHKGVDLVTSVALNQMLWGVH